MKNSSRPQSSSQIRSAAFSICCAGDLTGERKYPGDVLFYGVVSAQTEKVVEFFLEREAGEAMIGEVRGDEPELSEDLRVEAIELGDRRIGR